MNTEAPATEKDVQVLTDVLNGMLQLSSELEKDYNQIVSKLIEQKKKSPQLTLSENVVILSEPPMYSWDKLQELSKNIKRLSSRLMQMKAEQNNAQNEAKNAFAQLHAEREILIEKLNKLKEKRSKPMNSDALLRKISSFNP